MDDTMSAHMNVMNNHMNVMYYHINYMNNMMYNHMNVMNNHMNVMNNHINVMNNHINNMNNQNMGNNPNNMNYQNMENNPNMMNNQNMGNNPNNMNYQNMENNPNMMNNQNMGNNPNMMNNQNIGNNPNMMNNNNEEDNNNRFKDVYPYINGNKIQIILEGENNKRVYILIPTSLRSNELYYTARKYRNEILDKYYFSKIKLYHNNILLNDDDTPIEFINNGDTICMRRSISSSYQNIFQNQNPPMINIIFRFSDNIVDRFCRPFPINISIRQMFIFIFEEFFEENERNFFYFVYNGSVINTEDNTLLSNFFSIFSYYQNIEIKKFSNILEDLPGKVFNVSIQNNRNLELDFTVGTLEQIRSFRRRLNQGIENLRYSIINNPILNPGEGEIELSEDDERTFSSIGIRDNCICRVELAEI